MATLTARQHVIDLIGRLKPDQLITAARFLEFLLADPVSSNLTALALEDEEISQEEDQAVTRSKEWLMHNPGIPFEDVVAECGFTMEQISGHRNRG